MFTKFASFLAIFLILISSSTFVSANEVRLCTCSEASTCATEGTNQLDNCRKECANWLDNFSAKNNNSAALAQCFYEDGGPEGARMTKCMNKKITNFCLDTDATSPNANATLAQPNYDQWMEQPSANATISQSGGAFIRKARTAFRTFRNFQKCMNNCAKRTSVECFKKANCAVSLPSDHGQSLSIYSRCTLQNVHKDARDACRCLIQKHKVNQLAGICPIMSNSNLMNLV